MRFQSLRPFPHRGKKRVDGVVGGDGARDEAHYNRGESARSEWGTEVIEIAGQSDGMDADRSTRVEWIRLMGGWGQSNEPLMMGEGGGVEIVGVIQTVMEMMG